MMARILVIEPFYGGSHKQLLDTLLQNINPNEYDLCTLSAKKWHWRSRTSALYFSQTINRCHQYQIILASSVLNMAELVGMRPDLMVCKKIVYFHENQLVYPVRDVKERDCQYGLNQIMTCLAADIIIFNSHFNRKSFLNGINSYLNIQSDLKLRNISEQIEPKSEVLYFPIDFKQISRRESSLCSQVQVLHLLWPHRWEHDKNPQLLIDTLLELNKREVPFRVSIIGERFQTIPKCFEGIVEKLGNKLLNYGYLSRDDYFTCLRTADVVVSTAEHEFYGVSMLEAVYCGCVPLAPNRLVYPELYPKKYLYNTASQLVKILYNWCRNLTVFKKHRETFFESFSFEQFSTDILLPAYLKKLE